jgi:hypothetical protein
MKQTTAQMERLGVQVSGVHVSFLKEPLTVAYNMVGKLHTQPEPEPEEVTP